MGAWPEEAIHVNMGRKGGARTHPQQHHAHYPRNFYQPPEARRKSTMSIVRHSLVNTKWHTMTSMTFHHTPPKPHNPLPGWVEQVHLHTTTFHTSPSARLCPPFHLGPPLTEQASARPMEGAWSKVKGQTERGLAHSHHINRARAAPESQAN